MRRRLLRHIPPLLGLVVFAGALWAFHRELAQVHWSSVKSELASLPSSRIVLSLVFTALGYIVLTGYDFLGMQYLGQRLPRRRVFFASFLSYVFSNNVGLSVLGASAVRLRLYTAWGISAADVARLVAFVGVTFWLGILALCGMTFLALPIHLPDDWPISTTHVRLVGAALVLVVVGYLAACATVRRRLTIGSFSIGLPPIRTALLQPLVAMFDWVLASLALYALLPRAEGLTFSTFLLAYVAAQFAGLVSHVPGGLGVFESLFVLALKEIVPADTLLGCLLVYRVIYYVIPLALGAALLSVYELAVHRGRWMSFQETCRAWMQPTVPHVLSLLVFAAGLVLLVSGAMPAETERLHWLSRLLPLQVIEVSHFFGSVTGALLLVLGWALQRRLNAAYWSALVLLVAGVALSLLKGLDYEEAAILAVLAGLLVPCRSAFYRTTALLDAPLSEGWLVALAMGLGASVWIGLLAYRHVDYSDDLWWTFGSSADAARFLRATAGAAAALLVFSAVRLLHPAPPSDTAPDPRLLADAEAIVRACPRASAWLALLGDKRLLFDDARRAMVMYAVEGRSWIAMGDPVGPRTCWPDLLWRFREMAERHAGRCVFYQVMPDDLHLYADMGMAFWKLGEEARVPLESFSLDGPKQKDLRRETRRAEQMGCRFEVVPPEAAADVMPELKRVSDDWLQQRSGREKGFSLGFFDPAYLGRMPIAVVTHESRIVAFANVWLGGDAEEISPDLIRYSRDAPKGIMRFLFANLMDYGKQRGYAWFSLGMAPLSGMGTSEYAPLWHKLAHQVFRHGEHFYSFEGLRKFKESFDPAWTPKYLACRGGFQFPGVLKDLVALIGRKPPTD